MADKSYLFDTYRTSQSFKFNISALVLSANHLVFNVVTYNNIARLELISLSSYGTPTHRDLFAVIFSKILRIISRLSTIYALATEFFTSFLFAISDVDIFCIIEFFKNSVVSTTLLIKLKLGSFLWMKLSHRIRIINMRFLVAGR